MRGDANHGALATNKKREMDATSYPDGYVVASLRPVFDGEMVF